MIPRPKPSHFYLIVTAFCAVPTLIFYNFHSQQKVLPCQLEYAAPKRPEYLVYHCGHDKPSYWTEGHFGGRLGNVIFSVLNAASEAHSRGMQFGILNCMHPVLDMTPLHVNDSNAVMRYISPHNAFHTNYFEKGIGQHIFHTIAACIRFPVLRPLIAKLDVGNTMYDKDAVVIHIRSGDIFEPGGTSALYAPPPFSFYADIIDRHGGEVVVVSQQENLSPMVEKILNSYPKAKLQTRTLEEDISVILAAKYLVLAQGTFAWSLAMASTSLEVVYAFNNNLTIWDSRVLSGVKIVEYDADGYLSRWDATKKQIELMLTFPQNKLRRTEFKHEVRCSK